MNSVQPPYQTPLSPVWPGLHPDVQPVRTKVMGMKDECCVCKLRWKTAYNENDDVTASVIGCTFHRGKLDKTRMILSPICSCRDESNIF